MAKPTTIKEFISKKPLRWQTLFGSIGNDFNIVCSKHREFASWFNVQHCREAAGYPKNRITQEL